MGKIVHYMYVEMVIHEPLLTLKAHITAIAVIHWINTIITYLNFLWRDIQVPTYAWSKRLVVKLKNDPRQQLSLVCSGRTASGASHAKLLTQSFIQKFRCCNIHVFSYFHVLGIQWETNRSLYNYHAACRHQSLVIHFLLQLTYVHIACLINWQKL